MTLDKIAIKHGTDKATVHPRYGHGYTPQYELFFEPIRNNAIKLIEIGVGGGESIQTWLDYFPSAKVLGVDNVHGTNPWNTTTEKPNPRYTFINGDQSDRTMWKCLVADHGSDWDIIIDDGGHFNNLIIESFNAMWPHIKTGGLYCIEDLGASYGVGSIFVVAGYPSHMDFIKTKLDEINKSDKIAWLHLSKELAIIKKA